MRNYSAGCISGSPKAARSPIFVVSTAIALTPGKTEVTCRMDHVPLARGEYSVWMHIERGNDDDLIPWHPVASFVLSGSDLDDAPIGVVRLSPVHVAATWESAHRG